MKTWMMVAIVAGLLVLAGVVMIIGSQPVVADSVVADSGACSYGEAGCPYQEAGGCSQGANCGLDTCAAKYGGSCGCGGAK